MILNLQWVTDLAGNSGNEYADFLTKAGASLPIAMVSCLLSKLVTPKPSTTNGDRWRNRGGPGPPLFSGALI